MYFFQQILAKVLIMILECSKKFFQLSNTVQMLELWAQFLRVYFNSKLQLKIEVVPNDWLRKSDSLVSFISFIWF